MKYNFPRFGELEISDNEIIIFNEGLFGFENLHNYVIIKGDEDNIFDYLQSVEDLNVTFIITKPEYFKNDYILNIPDKDLDELGTKDVKNIIDYAIVTIPENIENMTANLQGPIIINNINKKAKQTISLNNSYHTKHKILEELSKAKK